MILTEASRRLYIGLGAIFAANMAILAMTRATIDLSNVYWPLAMAACFSALLMFSIRMETAGDPTPRARYFCEAMLFTVLLSLNVPVLNHLTLMAPFAYSDAILHSADLAMGVNWLSYFEFVHARPALIAAMELSYNYLTPVGLIVMTALIVMGRTRRVRFHIEVFFYTAVLCIVVGAAFPALAAVHVLIPDLAIYTNFDAPPGVYHLPWLEALRDPSQQITLDPNNLPGLVTFPSFHTASGVLLCIIGWRTWLMVPVTAYSALMIASSPVFGGHYFIDLIAGALAAVAASLRRRMDRKAAPVSYTHLTLPTIYSV